MGLLVFEQNGDATATSVYAINTWRGAQDGQIAMAADAIEYGGHQTANGFALQGVARVEDVRIDVQLIATARRFPISANEGLYEASVRTVFINASGQQEAATAHWDGDMAVAIRGGDICVYLHLGHEGGIGSSALFGCAPFDAHGRFSIAPEPDRASLEGQLQAGVMRAEWIDRRKSGAQFKGTLEAKRR